MIYEKGNYYHIYNRGCNKENIFYERNDYYLLLRKIESSLLRYNISLIAYCLIPNHYHFLVKQNGDIHVSRWLQTLFNGYVQIINQRLHRSGTLFESSAKPKLITDDKYLIDSVNYIHYNPIKHGLVQSPEKWIFSSYLDWIGERKSKIILPDIRDSYFKNPKDYEESFMNYLATQNLEKVSAEEKLSCKPFQGDTRKE